jgi:hypothetical protein
MSYTESQILHFLNNNTLIILKGIWYNTNILKLIGWDLRWWPETPCLLNIITIIINFLMEIDNFKHSTHTDIFQGQVDKGLINRTACINYIPMQ